MAIGLAGQQDTALITADILQMRLCAHMVALKRTAADCAQWKRWQKLILKNRRFKAVLFYMVLVIDLKIKTC